MVGVGIEGNESSLARVSIVNYTGSIILDDFVRQREKVVDYRTRWSGVRSTDLAGSGTCFMAYKSLPSKTDCGYIFTAKSFKEVQETVAEVIKDRVLVGHAVYNDLKVRAFHIRDIVLVTLRAYRPSCSPIHLRRSAIPNHWHINTVSSNPVAPRYVSSSSKNLASPSRVVSIVA